MAKEVKLKVVESIQEDINKGVVRIDSGYMKELEIKLGDFIELEGARKTYAIVDRALPADIGRNVIRVDGLIRHNAKTGIGDMVTARKAEVKEAKKIIIAPARGIFQTTTLHQIKRDFLGRVVAKGDIISPGGSKRRRAALSGNPFIDFESIFSMMEDNRFGFVHRDIKFVVAETNPKQAVIITDNTELKLNPQAVEVKEETIPEVSYEDIGGLQEEIRKIREMVELPLRHPEIFERLGIEPPKGVLLHGPPGTGKTLLAKAVATETNSHFIVINGPEIMSKYYGQSEENLRKKFEEAEQNAPAIVFIDEIDAIASKREETKGEVERRVVAQLLASMDGLQSRGKVVVIGATNVPNILDPALRRPGRFDRELEIGVPNKEGRENILKIHTRHMPLSKDVNLTELAAQTHGFVGADVASLAKEAAMIVLRRVLPDLKYEKDESIPKEFLEKLKITKQDFRDALKVVRPSALREVFIDVPNVKWSDVGGLDDVRQELVEAVEWPLKHPESFKRMGVKPPKGILLYGAPGTGKTLIAKAIANESEANFISVKGPELLCVSKDTNILTDFCGVRTIEDFYDKIIPISKIEKTSDKLEVRKLKKPIHSFAITNNGNLIKSKIKTAHKLFVDQGYTIAFSNNGQITGSKNQPLLVFRDNSIKWRTLKNLQVGDYVAYPVKLPALDKKIEINFPQYKHIIKVKEDEDKYYAKIFSTKTITALPKYLTKNLASFLGWFASEGSITKEGISICNYNKENQKEIKELFKQFVEESRITNYKDKIVVYSTVLVKYLEEIFEQNLGTKKSYTINCPSIITKTSKDIIKLFLKSAYKGDGITSKTKIEYCTMSRNLAEGISYLLTLLEIKYRIWQRKDKAHMITISGKKEIDKFKINILDLKIENKIRNNYNARYILPPISSLLKKSKKILTLHYDRELPDGSFEHVISGRRRIGLIRLQRIMKIYDKYADKTFKKSQIYNTLSFMAKGNVLWTKVQSKKNAKPQIMYDVETEHGSFIGGNIPFILHNSKWVGESEKAVREVIKKARQTAPTIVFFDEIDSLVPRRGISSDSHVSERVVNQLLTEIDGLEDMHDILIIGATNRPDMLDTALLRPGRFDRIILTPAPNTKAREEIFKIHTAEMPLKGITAAELAEKTPGYVGADIEAICREAAIMALRENMESKEITAKHFEKAIEKVKPSITPEIENAYKELKGHFTSAKAKELQTSKPAYFG